MRLLLALFCCLISALAYSPSGMVAYKKLCSSCHGPAFKGAAMQTSEEWEEIFANKAAKLKKIHRHTPKAMEKIESSYFKRRLKHLAPFLRNNGRDMGVVRSCDGLNCG